MRSVLCESFVPLHYGFGDKHFVKCDDGSIKQFTKKLVLEELSWWISVEIAETFWGKVFVTGVVDGTSFLCQSFGGYIGNKELYSVHKAHSLQKVMGICTSRGYWIKNFAGCGGSGRYSDMKLLDYIMDGDKAELQKDPDAPNLISFFGLTPETARLVKTCWSSTAVSRVLQGNF